MLGDDVLEISHWSIGDAAIPTEEFLGLTVSGDSAASTVYAPYYSLPDSGDIEFSCFGFVNSRYTGGGINLVVPWASVISNSGNIILRAGFRRMDTAERLDLSHTYAFQSVTAACPGTLRFPAYPIIVFSSSQVDGILKGEMFNLQIQRQASSGSDTMTGSAAVFPWAVHGIETAV